MNCVDTNDLASVVPALLHYADFSALFVVQKRGDHWDKPKWREIQQARQASERLTKLRPKSEEFGYDTVPPFFPEP